MSFSGIFICATCKPLAVAKISRGDAIGTAWRKGKLLVVGREGSLPIRCFRCNSGDDVTKIKRRLYWHPPLVYVLIVAPLLFILVGLFTRRTQVVHVPICGEHKKRRMRQQLYAGGLAIIGLGISIAAAFTATAPSANSQGITVAMVGLGMLLVLVAIIWGVVASRMVYPSRITRTHAFLGGAGSDFLAQLPTWVESL